LPSVHPGAKPNVRGSGVLRTTFRTIWYILPALVTAAIAANNGRNGSKAVFKSACNAISVTDFVFNLEHIRARGAQLQVFQQGRVAAKVNIDRIAIV
jgi:hypothetical protein